MGKTEGNIVESMEDMLGLLDDKSTESDGESQESEEQEADDSAGETASPSTVSLTDEQLSISKDITKIELQIEELEKKEVNVEDFYSNLDTHLSEEEQALEFEDKAAYMKLVNQKLKEFEETNSSKSAIEELNAKKEELQGVYDRQSAIANVMKEYPKYNHEKVLSFFNEDLSKKEQDDIYKNAASYEDVYKNAYKKYLEKHPTNIAQSKAPNIPDVSQTRKKAAEFKDTDSGMLSDDERLQAALGL